MTLFGKVAAIEVGVRGGTGKRLEGLRVSFSARHNGSGTPNETEFSIFNVSASTLGLFEKKKSVVRVFAGYAEAEGAVLIGEGSFIRDGLSIERDRVDLTVKGKLGDGGDLLRDVRVGVSIRGRIDAETVLEEIRKQLGVTKGIVKLGVNVVFDRGYLEVGPVRRMLRDLGRTTKSRISISDGRLTAYPIKGERKVFGHVISPETGLIGSPRASKEGVEIRSLLLPSLRPGDAFRLRSRRYEGDYVVKTCEHSGDTHGGDFVTRAIGRKRR